MMERPRPQEEEVNVTVNASVVEPDSFVQQTPPHVQEKQALIPNKLDFSPMKNSKMPQDSVASENQVMEDQQVQPQSRISANQEMTYPSLSKMPAYTPLEHDSDLKKYLMKAPIQMLMATAMVPIPPSMKEKVENQEMVQENAAGEQENVPVEEGKEVEVEEMEIREVTEFMTTEEGSPPMEVKNKYIVHKVTANRDTLF